MVTYLLLPSGSFSMSLYVSLCLHSWLCFFTFTTMQECACLNYLWSNRLLKCSLGIIGVLDAKSQPNNFKLWIPLKTFKFILYFLQLAFSLFFFSLIWIEQHFWSSLQSSSFSYRNWANHHGYPGSWNPMENCFLSIHHASLMVHLEISWFTAAIIMLWVGEMAIGSGDTPPTPHLAAPTTSA
jgi:hypothetical protein